MISGPVFVGAWYEYFTCTMVNPALGMKSACQLVPDSVTFLLNELEKKLSVDLYDPLGLCQIELFLVSCDHIGGCHMTSVRINPVRIIAEGVSTFSYWLNGICWQKL